MNIGSTDHDRADNLPEASEQTDDAIAARHY
jgi:hypothetical protein